MAQMADRSWVQSLAEARKIEEYFLLFLVMGLCDPPQSICFIAANKCDNNNGNGEEVILFP